MLLAAQELRRLYPYDVGRKTHVFGAWPPCLVVILSNGIFESIHLAVDAVENSSMPGPADCSHVLNLPHFGQFDHRSSYLLLPLVVDTSTRDFLHTC